MPTVKTAISIESELFKDITRRARKAGVLRSRYIADAVQTHIRTQDREEMKRRINAAYANETDEDRKLRRLFQHHAAKLLKGTW